MSCRYLGVKGLIMTDTKTEDPGEKAEESNNKRRPISIKIDINKATWLALISALGAGGYTGWSSFEAGKNRDETKVGVELQVNDAWKNTRDAITKLTSVIRKQNQHIESLQREIEVLNAVASKAHPGSWQRATRDMELDEIEEMAGGVDATGDEPETTPTSMDKPPPSRRGRGSIQIIDDLETELPSEIQFPKMERVQAAIEKGNGS